MNGQMAMRGAVRARVIRPAGPGLMWKLMNLMNLWRGFWRIAVARLLNLATLEGRLYARVVRADGSVVDFGLVSLRVVTTAFVNYMTDSLQGAQADWVNFKYHDAGTGTVNEAVGDTGLGTAWGGSRATGTQTEGASANIYRSVGTISFNNTFAITEHGLFNASTVGTLMDRSKFAAINVLNGDSIQFTYELTNTAGS